MSSDQAAAPQPVERVVVRRYAKLQMEILGESLRPATLAFGPTSGKGDRTARLLQVSQVAPFLPSDRCALPHLDGEVRGVVSGLTATCSL